MDDIVISTYKIFLLLNPPYSSSRNCGTSQWKIVAIGSIPTNQKQNNQQNKYSPIITVQQKWASLAKAGARSAHLIFHTQGSSIQVGFRLWVQPMPDKHPIMIFPFNRSKSDQIQQSISGSCWFGCRLWVYSQMFMNSQSHLFNFRTHILS